MAVFHKKIYPVCNNYWKILGKAEARKLCHCLRTAPRMSSEPHALREFVFLKQLLTSSVILTVRGSAFLLTLSTAFSCSAEKSV